MSPTHRGHQELLDAVGVSVLFSVEDGTGLWHVRLEVLEIDPDRDVLVEVYAQGGPPDEPPDHIQRLSVGVPLAQAHAVARSFAAARSLHTAA